MKSYDPSSTASKDDPASRENKDEGVDHVGKSIMTTGPVLVSYDQSTKAAVPLDALYVLDYKARRLRASLPVYRQSAQSTTIIESFVERDLAADFKVDFDRGPRPRFLMTTGSLGPYTAGQALSLRHRDNQQSTRGLPPQHSADNRQGRPLEIRARADEALRQPERGRPSQPMSRAQTWSCRLRPW